MASCVEKVEWVQVQAAFSVRSFQYTAREGYGQPERELQYVAQNVWLFAVEKKRNESIFKKFRLHIHCCCLEGAGRRKVHTVVG